MLSSYCLLNTADWRASTWTVDVNSGRCRSMNSCTHARAVRLPACFALPYPVSLLPTMLMHPAVLMWPISTTSSLWANLPEIYAAIDAVSPSFDEDLQLRSIHGSPVSSFRAPSEDAADQRIANERQARQDRRWGSSTFCLGRGAWCFLEQR